MTIKEEDIPEDMLERVQATADVLERRLLKAVGAADAELARVIRNSEAEFERLTRRIAATLAELAVESVFRGWTGGAPSGETGAAPSPNGIAKAITRAARRGARFA